jgi:hypothetical protein
MKVLSLLVALGAVGCSSKGSPATPTPVVVPPAVVTATVTGRVTALNGGQALSGVAVGLGDVTAMTDASGAFSSSPVPFGSLRVTVTGPGIVPRAAMASVQTSRILPVDAIALSGGFDLGFYRAFVRNTYASGGGLEELRRWTSAPRIYLRTVDDAGAPIDVKTLDATERTITDTAAIWTGGRFGIAGLERGTETRVGTLGWITVRWAPSTTSDHRCGQADVAVSGGAMGFFYKEGGDCRCPGVSEIALSVVRHELGHAFGYWHTDSRNDVMYERAVACDAQPSARERYHAAIAYARPVGNVDPDTDPASSVLSLPHRSVF